MTRFDTYLCVAAGGQLPRVDALNPATRAVVSLVAMPPGQSVYRGVACHKGRSLIVATKPGVVQHYSFDEASPGSDPLVVRRSAVHIGAPLLGIAGIGKDFVVASSMTGTLVVLKAQGLQVVRRFRTSGPAVCAIAPVDDDTFATLDVRGRIEMWSMPKGECLQYVDAPPPPARWASVGLHYWKEYGVLAYPGLGGRMAMVDLGTGVIKCNQAHSDDFYAVCLGVRELTTFGFADGLRRRWNQDLRPAGVDRICPRGVISAAYLDREGHEAVTVCEDGNALYIQENGEHSEGVPTFAGKGYRAAWSPDFDALDEAARQQRAVEIRETAYEIANQLDAGVALGHEARLQKMKDSGHLPVFHALSARAAETSGDIVAALAHYRAMSERMPRPIPHAADRPMTRFANLLFKSWQLVAAMRVYDSVMEDNPAHGCRELADRCRSLTSAIAERPYLVEADMAIPDLIACADASGNAFTGKWVVKAFDTLRCPGVELTPEVLEAIQTQIVDTQMGSDWDICLSDVCCLSGAGLCATPAMVAGHEGLSRVSLLYVARFMSVSRDLIVKPCAVLSVRGIAEDHAPASHNRVVAQEWSRTGNDANAWSEVFAIHESTISALRQVLTARAAVGIAIGGKEA